MPLRASLPISVLSSAAELRRLNSFDGIMGLAQSTLSNQGVPTAIEFLAAAGTVPSAQIGYRLARLSDGTNDGQITFGGVECIPLSTVAEAR